jgi:hypothetical protein
MNEKPQAPNDADAIGPETSARAVLDYGSVSREHHSMARTGPSGSARTQRSMPGSRNASAG